MWYLGAVSNGSLFYKFERGDNVGKYGVKDSSFSIWQHNIGKKIGIKGNEILAYVLIQTFTENKGAYKGGLTYLSECLNCRTATAQSIIDSLLEKELIEKIPTKDKVRFHYKICITETVKQNDSSITEIDNLNYGNRNASFTENENLNYGNRKATITETVKRSKENKKKNKEGNKDRNIDASASILINTLWEEQNG